MNVTTKIKHLKQSALQLAAAFDEVEKISQAEEKAAALRMASVVLIEMRRTTDDLANEFRYAR